MNVLLSSRDRRALILVSEVFHLETARGLATRATSLELVQGPAMAPPPRWQLKTHRCQRRGPVRPDESTDRTLPIPRDEDPQPLRPRQRRLTAASRGEPVALKGVRRVRRAVRGNGTTAMPPPRPGPTQHTVFRGREGRRPPQGRLLEGTPSRPADRGRDARGSSRASVTDRAFRREQTRNRHHHPSHRRLSEASPSHRHSRGR